MNDKPFANSRARENDASAVQKFVFYTLWCLIGAVTLLLFFAERIALFGVTWQVNGGATPFAILILEFGAMWLHAQVIQLASILDAYRAIAEAWSRGR